MITIPKKVEYSILFLSFLSKNPGKMISLSETAEKIYLPYRFLGQVALQLKNGGLVESREGKMGGFFLKEGWEKKSLYELIEILGENKHLVRCLPDSAACKRSGNCNLRPVWQKVEAGMLKELKKIKLGEVK